MSSLCKWNQGWNSFKPMAVCSSFRYEMTSFIKVPGKDPIMYLITDMNKTRQVIEMLGKTRLELNEILENAGFTLKKGQIPYKWACTRSFNMHVFSRKAKWAATYFNVRTNSFYREQNEIAPESYAQDLVKSAEEEETERIERYLKKKEEEKKMKEENEKKKKVELWKMNEKIRMQVVLV